MDQNKFVVKYAKGLFIFYFLILLVIPWWLMIKNVPILIKVIYCIFLFCILVPNFIRVATFRVNVDGTNFKVRKGIMNYQFDISEVKKISFYNSFSSRHSRLIVYLKISTNSKVFSLEYSLQGFEKLVEYLLQRYDTGDLNKNAVSDKCHYQLVYYKNYFRKINQKNKKENVIQESNVNEELECKREMFTTIVKIVRRQDKEALNICLILGGWVMLCLIIFILAISVSEFFLLLLFIVFLSIVPIIFYLLNKSKRLIKKSFEKKELVFYVQNNNLYTNNLLLDIDYDKYTNTVLISHFSSIYNHASSNETTFSGVIEAPYVNDFIDFLKRNDIGVYDIYDNSDD